MIRARTLGGDMKEPYLEVTFRHGRPLAAYYHLPRDPDTTCARLRRVEPGFVVDYSESGVVIGIEITAPGTVTLEGFYCLLEELGVAPMGEAEFAPLHAA